MESEKLDYTKESILIVDDDLFLRDTLEKLLRTLGLPTSSISNGSDALKLLSEQEFTFVLTDMKMPGIDGMELIQKISADFDVNVIAMTGYSEGYKYVDVITAGASDFIKKPFGIEELEAKIRRILTERDLRVELNRLSITDSLTELFNQRHFYSRLRYEVTRANRQKHSLSLILLDLDGFKNYNDTYGHLAGDEILRHTGEIINNSIRDGVDTGYRYGGDEFAVILIDADMDIAKEIGLRIQNVFKDNGEITVSIGYSKFTIGMSATDLVSEADKELYRAKVKRKRSL